MDSSSDENAHITEVSDTDYEPLPRQSEPYPPRRGQRVLATVYDAVAGRVTYDKVLRDEDLERNQLPTGVSQQRQQQRPSRDYLKLAPEDVLFRRKDAPERYEEHDIYRAHERDLIITIPNAGGGDGGVGRGGGSNSNSSRIVGRVLPESDLLQAVHSYSSQFYGALNRQDAQQRLPAPPPPTVKGQRQQRRNVDECSMDETALLAFGILLEEAAREVLGRRGHLVFTEPAADEDGEQEEEEPSHHHHRRHRGGSRRRGGDGAEELELYQGSGVVVIGHQGGLVGSSAQRSGPKRRRLAKTEDEMTKSPCHNRPTKREHRQHHRPPKKKPCQKVKMSKYPRGGTIYAKKNRPQSPTPTPTLPPRSIPCPHHSSGKQTNKAKKNIDSNSNVRFGIIFSVSTSQNRISLRPLRKNNNCHFINFQRFFYTFWSTVRQYGLGRAGWWCQPWLQVLLV